MSDNVQDRNDQLENSFEVPTKYKGKSVEDVVKMHMEAEKRVSQLGNEVGTLKQMADRLLGLEHARQVNTRDERKPITTEEILEDPNQALEKAIEQHSGVASTKEELQRLRFEVAQSKFERAFPNYEQDLNNPDFVDWVKNSKIRTALGVAANSGDYDAANSLWELWEERNTDLKEVQAKKKELRKQQEKLGTLEGPSTSGLESEKIYSREEMIALKQKVVSGDPAARAKFNDPAFQAEYIKAYADKRVK